RLTHLAKDRRIGAAHSLEGGQHGLESQRKLRRDVLVRLDLSVQRDLRPRRNVRLLPRHARLRIREGEVEGTDISGLKIAAIADTPKVMTEGNWRLGVFVDENATDEQADKLVKVFT